MAFEFDDDFFWRMIDRRIKARRHLAERWARLDRVVLADRSLPDMGAMITRCAREPARWQATFFDRNGISGDAIRDTKVQAVQEAIERGYRRLAPDLLRRLSCLESFHRGNAAVEAMHRAESDCRAKAEMVDCCNTP